MAAGNHELAAKVREALQQVLDPELGWDVVNLGLIYSVTAEEGRVEIVMTVTAPGCPVQSLLEEAVREAARRVPGVRSVDVRLVFSPPWDPEMMSDEAKRYFGYA